jgi:ATP-dependent helicase HrpB
VQVLEPRRLAARAAATRMAEILGESVGQTVGYRMRMDTKVSRATRVEVVTDGILLRRLQGDPALEGCAAVLLDEFHERSLEVRSLPSAPPARTRAFRPQ